MDEPVITQKKPYKLEMQPGVYFWCACGRSQNQPFCDGSHRGTGFSPVRVEVTEQQLVAWCGCRRSAKGPHCDGTHKKLAD
ncbi:MAG: CDGSH iron-sulfur domain-containing protein [Thermoanaerobaculum sp.]|nr:CDGSH iron-sulfur domain-containing protein [Thermoanaerobaculum sp.]MCX7894919.1 CDGSH iron-sulfur domain-containing protein [Thermoanaerobaculum sp.]MDW7967587.1 CDGSH iron-sulfur domain-containing protein [Thermoanaerobaculum sp.]